MAIVAVHALGPLDRWHDPDASARSWRKALCDLVDQTWCGPLARAASPHRVEVREGHPVDVLLAITAAERAALLVVGSRSIAAAPAQAPGSTSRGVAQWAPVPVLVVPDRCDGPSGSDALALRHLVVGVDGSPPSFAALAVAADVAEPLGASLTVLHVFTRHGHALDRTMSLVGAELGAIRDRGVRAHTVVRSGDPAATLVEVADDLDADLVVVGRRGGGEQGELLLGSVARTVTDGVRRPILVVPASAGRLLLPGLRSQPTMADATTK
jgi:nucleotide-binding universal stress UspA family protein